MNEDYYSAEKRYARRTAHARRSIDGVEVGSSRCVAFCRFDGHPCFLTEKQRREHDCLGKDCRYYLAKPDRQKEKVGDFDQSSAVLRFCRRRWTRKAE